VFYHHHHSYAGLGFSPKTPTTHIRRTWVFVQNPYSPHRQDLGRGIEQSFEKQGTTPSRNYLDYNSSSEFLVKKLKIPF
jgi:hypothetical protein